MPTLTKSKKTAPPMPPVSVPLPPLTTATLERTEQSRARVIEFFEQTGRVDRACELAGVSRGSHYAWMKDADYKATFEAARDRAIDLLEDKARERAMSGESDRLLEFLLRGLRPDVYGDRMKLAGDKDAPLTITVKRLDK